MTIADTLSSSVNVVSRAGGAEAESHGWPLAGAAQPTSCSLPTYPTSTLHIMHTQAHTYQFPSCTWASTLDHYEVSALRFRVGWTSGHNNQWTNEQREVWVEWSNLLSVPGLAHWTTTRSQCWGHNNQWTNEQRELWVEWSNLLSLNSEHDSYINVALVLTDALGWTLISAVVLCTLIMCVQRVYTHCMCWVVFVSMRCLFISQLITVTS